MYVSCSTVLQTCLTSHTDRFTYILEFHSMVIAQSHCSWNWEIETAARFFEESTLKPSSGVG